MTQRVSHNRTGCATRQILAALCGAVALLVPFLPAQPQAPDASARVVAGIVRDSSGAPIAGARVEFRRRNFTTSALTDDEGHFRLDLSGAPSAPSAPGRGSEGSIHVEARGFAPLERGWTASDPDARHLDVVLAPAAITQRVTVTANRIAMAANDTTASTVVLTSEDLASTAALELDDELRQVPGFQLFRRSSSRVANPTSQGVSLRGVGSSGASRALVLENGIPLNDPFGGWVYWDRLPREAVSAVEVVTGGASDLYGTDAMGGVINVITRRPVDSALSFESSYGNETTPDASFAASLHAGRWGFGLDGEAFHTDGFVPVPGTIRGAADSLMGSDFSAARLIVDRTLSDRARLFARASIFGERRANGTIDQGNDTRVRELELGSDWQSEALGAFALRAWGSPEVYDQNFFSIGLNRSSETLTRDQRVPSHSVGGSAQWSRPAGARQTLVAGIDAHEVRGASDELAFSPLAPAPGAVVEPVRLTSAVDAGGRERVYGVFGEDIIRPAANWVVTLGARYDHWRNYDALMVTQPLSKPSPATVINFADRTEQAVSPRLAVLRRVNEHFSLSASAYQAFRAPSLNELYRSFRLGNTLTLANDNLRAERLTGAEAGANYAALDNRLVLRGAFFWSDISRPIENVTLSVAPALITRERENLGRTRSRGIDLDATARLTPHLELTGGYELAETAVVSFPANTALVGLWVPEVPRHMATLQARYSNPSASNRFARINFAVQGRMVGAQFDDDQNQFKLGRFFTLDAIVSRSLTHNLEVFVASENLLNQRYDIELTPTEMLGAPALVRAGVRVNLRSR